MSKTKKHNKQNGNNGTNNNHFLAQGFLKNFFNNDKIRCFYKCDKYEENVIAVKDCIQTATAMNNIYTIKWFNGVVDNKSVEKFYSKTLESNWGQCIDCLINDKHGEFKSKTKQSLTDFLLCYCLIQITRTPFAINETTKLMNLILHGSGFNVKIGQSDAFIVEDLKVKGFATSVFSSFGIQNYEKSFEIIKNNTDINFITSDNPVMIHNEEGCFSGMYSKSKGSFTLCVALTQKMLLRIKFSETNKVVHPNKMEPINVKEIGNECLSFVKGVNALVFKYAYRYVYFKVKLELNGIEKDDEPLSPVLNINEARNNIGDISCQIIRNLHIYRKVQQTSTISIKDIYILTPYLMNMPIKMGRLTEMDILWLDKNKSKVPCKFCGNRKRSKKVAQ